MIKETQAFLNYYVKDILVNDINRNTTRGIDGVQGAMTNAAIAQVLTKLEKKFKQENLKWNDKFNFIGIRTDNDLDNSFDDWFVITINGTLIAYPASTVSGIPGIAKYFNRTINNVSGVGTIKGNQQIDYLLVAGKNNGWANWTGGLGFLFQDKGISVHRGAIKVNGNWETNTNVLLHNQFGGFNVHSWIGYFLNTVNNLSEGCQVTKQNYWIHLFPILQKNTINGRIVYTLINNYD